MAQQVLLFSALDEIRPPTRQTATVARLRAGQYGALVRFAVPGRSYEIRDGRAWGAAVDWGPSWAVLASLVATYKRGDVTATVRDIAGENTVEVTR